MTILLCHRMLVPLTGPKANSHNKIVIPVVTFLIFPVSVTPNQKCFQTSHRAVILRGCDFDLCGFDTPNQRIFQTFPQRRHPERSASQIYLLTEGLWRAVEGPQRCFPAAALHSFPAAKIMKEIKKVTASDPSVPGFPTTRHSSTTTYAAFRRGKPHEIRQRHHFQQEIRGSVVEGPAVSFARHEASLLINVKQ